MKKVKVDTVQIEKRSLRDDFLKAIDSWRADVSATVRYYKSHDMYDKLTSNWLARDEENELMKRYGALADLDPERNHIWDVVNWMVSSKKFNSLYYGRREKKLSVPANDDDLVIEDIIWDEDEIDLILEMMNKYGYKRIQYLDSSTAVMRSLSDFVAKGCTVVGSNQLMRRSFSDEDWEVDKKGVIVQVPENVQ